MTCGLQRSPTPWIHSPHVWTTDGMRSLVWLAAVVMGVGGGCEIEVPEHRETRVPAYDVYEDIDGDGLIDAARIDEDFDGRTIDQVWLDLGMGSDLATGEHAWTGVVPIPHGSRLLGVVDIGEQPTLVANPPDGPLLLIVWAGAEPQVRTSTAPKLDGCHGVAYGHAANRDRWLGVTDCDNGRSIQPVRPADGDVAVGPMAPRETLGPTRAELALAEHEHPGRRSYGNSVAWADLDGNGELDLFTVYETRVDVRDDEFGEIDPNLSYTKRHGFIHFSFDGEWSTPFPTKYSRLGAVADFDGDGVAEIIVQSGGGSLLDFHFE